MSSVCYRTPTVWPLLSGVSTGTNVRRRRLNPTDFLTFKVPVPPIEVQRQIREVKTRGETINRLQAETKAELDALLPAVLDRAFKGEL